MMLIMQFLAPAVMVVAKIYNASRRGVGGMLEEGLRAASEEYGLGGVNNVIALGDSARGMRDEFGGGGAEDEDEENGLQLTNIFNSMARGAVLGGGPAMPRTSKFDVANPLSNPPSSNAGKQPGKNKADTGRPNSSFEAFRNPALKGASKNKNKKNGGVVVAKLENEIVAKGEAIARELLKGDKGGGD